MCDRYKAELEYTNEQANITKIVAPPTSTITG